MFLVAAAHAADARTVQCETRHFTVERASLAYEDCGQGTVVLIHPGGPGLNARYMLGLARVIAADGYRAILFEPRGTGRSAAALADEEQLTVAGSVADLEALRAAVGAERVVLIGHSFGGAVAQAYAAVHPDRIARLVLLDSVGPSLGRAPMPLDGWRKRLRPDELTRYDFDRARGDVIGAMRIKFLGSFYHRARGQAFLRTLDPGSIDVSLGHLTRDYAEHYHIAAQDPARTLPVAIVSGDIDWIRGYEPALLQTYPGAQVYHVPHAGHFPWIDSPQATRQLLPSILTGAPPHTKDTRSHAAHARARAAGSASRV